jgi:hypothetical protein
VCGGCHHVEAEGTPCRFRGVVGNQCGDHYGPCSHCGQDWSNCFCKRCTYRHREGRFKSHHVRCMKLLGPRIPYTSDEYVCRDCETHGPRCTAHMRLKDTTEEDCKVYM